MSRRWCAGRVFVIRHAGMPFDWLEDLGADPAVISSADLVLDRAAELLAAAGDRADELAAGVLDGRLPGVRLPAEATAALQRWSASWSEFASHYDKADTAVAEQLREVLVRPEVAEAVFLSNPDAYHNMLVPLVEQARPLNARWRRARRQMYTYVQRFCAKNETVSYFGPMAYATAGERTVLRRSKPQVRRVFFADWAFRALVRAVARDTRLLPHLRFHPIVREAPDTGRASFAALSAAEGGLRFAELVRARGCPARDVATELRALVAAGAVDVELGSGTIDSQPLTTLGDQLTELPPSAAREEWIERVRDLDIRLAAMADQPLAERIVTVAEIESRFTAITGVPARRGAGATYADRAVFFEECSSPFELEVSPAQWAEWEQRLAPVLEVCTAHGAATQAAATALVRDALAAAGHDPDAQVDLRTWSARAATALEQHTTAAPSSAFRTGHAPVYHGDHAAEIATLQGRAAELPGDRYAMIDLCPRATGPGDLPGADLIVARTHHQLLVHSWLDTMFDDDERFAADATDWVRDQGESLVGFDFGRRNKGFYHYPGRRVAFRPLTWSEPSSHGPDRVEDYTVVPGPGAVTLIGPEGHRCRAYLPLSDFTKFPPTAALSAPQVVHPAFTGSGSRSEIRVGDVVVQRARWELRAADLIAATPHGRFLQLRRVARTTGARFVFCRSETERKPYLLDLCSPLAADLLGHVARHGEVLVVEPMTPEPDLLWLRDEDGRRYTSEARMQFIGRDDRTGR